MAQAPDYSDSRLTSSCLYCGGVVSSREHTPSKVLLDAPYPSDLSVVGACQPCNEGFSKDEEYLACLIECAIQGSTDPERLKRPSVARKLKNQPGLRNRLEQARSSTGGATTFTAETDRVKNVVCKLAQGHVLYELSEVLRDKPVEAWATPIATLGQEARSAFEQIEQPSFWPEVGCRMSSRLIGGEPGWQIVQQDRYRYAVMFGGPTVARMVLSEYLACQVVWDD